LVSVGIGPGLDIHARLSPDGKFLAAPDAHATVRLWDVRSGRELRRFRHGPPAPALLRTSGGSWRAFCFSGDGRLLASASPDARCVRIWDVGGKEVRKLDVPIGLVLQAVWLPGTGQILATLDQGNTLALREVATGREIGSFPTAPWKLVFSPDGQAVACVGS